MKIVDLVLDRSGKKISFYDKGHDWHERKIKINNAIVSLNELKTEELGEYYILEIDSFLPAKISVLKNRLKIKYILDDEEYVEYFTILDNNRYIVIGKAEI